MKPVILAVLVALAVLAASPRNPATAGASVVYVDATASGLGNGTTWTHAYRNLRTAIATTAAPAEIWVARGLYKPTALVTNKDSTFTLKNGVAIYGGFRGDERDRARRNPAVNVTLLSGDIGAGIDSDNTYHVVSASGPIGTTAVLDGFTIRGGNANGTVNNGSGGGVFTGTGSPTLANLVIEGNAASASEGRGGGLYVLSGSPVLVNVTFSGNWARASGGGMYIGGGSPKLTNVVFRGNSATSNGGGLNNIGTTVIDGAVFEYNTTTFTGGAAANLGTLTVSRALFHANRSQRGGAIANYTGTLSVRDSTFDGNVAFTYGGAIANEQSELSLTNVTSNRNNSASGASVENYKGTGLVRNSVFWGGTSTDIVDDVAAGDLTIVDSLVAGGCPANSTCTSSDILTADPLLGPLQDNGGFSRTRGLTPASPAVDAADDASCSPIDQRGVPRPVDGDKDGSPRCDLGAFELIPALPAMSFAQAGSLAPEATSVANVTVALTTTALSPVTVRYKVLGGSASGRGKDYTLAAGKLTFAPLTSSRSIPVSIVNDRLDEPVETVLLQLIAPTGATLGSPAIHKLRIKDDDPAVACRGRAATIVGTAGNDTIAGTKRADVIAGLGGNDAIAGGGGDDIICGGAGNDRLAGNAANDVLVGAAGNDRLLGQDGADQLFGLGGADRLSGGPGNLDACDGGPANDILLPNAGCESVAGVP